jgi:hypothetical protein
MVHNNFVVLNEICHRFKLMYVTMYLFLRHVYYTRSSDLFYFTANWYFI